MTGFFSFSPLKGNIALMQACGASTFLTEGGRPVRKAIPSVNVCLRIDLPTEKLRRRLQKQLDCSTPELFERALHALDAHPDDDASRPLESAA